MQLDKDFLEVLSKTEWVSITTLSSSTPHVVAAWGYRLRKFNKHNDGVFLLPAGKYFQTEENLKENSQIQLLIVSDDIKRPNGEQGQGYRIIGTAEIQTKGAMSDLVKTEFPWARGALVIKIEKIEALL